MIIFQKVQDSLDSQKTIKTKNTISEECGKFFKTNMMSNSKQPRYLITTGKLLISKDRKYYSKYLQRTWIALKTLGITKTQI